jgi:hypothetical protein
MGYHSKKRNYRGISSNHIRINSTKFDIYCFVYFLGRIRDWYLVPIIVLLPIFTILVVKGHMVRKKLAKSARFKFDLIVLILIIILMIGIIYLSKGLG